MWLRTVILRLKWNKHETAPEWTLCTSFSIQLSPSPFSVDVKREIDYFFPVFPGRVVRKGSTQEAPRGWRRDKGSRKGRRWVMNKPLRVTSQPLLQEGNTRKRRRRREDGDDMRGDLGRERSVFVVFMLTKNSADDIMCDILLLVCTVVSYIFSRSNSSYFFFFFQLEGSYELFLKYCL